MAAREQRLPGLRSLCGWILLLCPIICFSLNRHHHSGRFWVLPAPPRQSPWPLQPVFCSLKAILYLSLPSSLYSVCVCVCVRCVTADISGAAGTATLGESSLHLGLLCPWILWVLVLSAMAAGNDISHICLTADRLVLTHTPKMPIAFRGKCSWLNWDFFRSILLVMGLNTCIQHIAGKVLKLSSVLGCFSG